MTETPTKATGFPIFTTVAGAMLVLSFFAPRMLLIIPVMVTVGLAIVGAVRKERPNPIPYMVGAASVMLLLVGSGIFAPRGSPAPQPLTASSLYKDATWQYGSATDAMRGTVSKWATLDSPTDLSLAAPYEGQNAAHIQVGDLDSLILTIDKGQLLCQDTHRVSVKFDAGPVWSYHCEAGANGDSKTIYLEWAVDEVAGQPKNIVDGIAKAKTMMIEVPIYDNGFPQLTFHVTGLDLTKLK